jgi:hypothetical protein
VFAGLISILLLGAADPGPSAATAVAPAAAPGASAAPLSTPGAPQRRPVDRTCWVEKPAGSHIPMPICATPEELEKAQRDGRDAVTGELRSSRGGFQKKP